MRKIVSQPLYLIALGYIVGIFFAEFTIIPVSFYGYFFAIFFLLCFYKYSTSKYYYLYKFKSFLVLLGVLGVFFFFGTINRGIEKTKHRLFAETSVEKSCFVVTDVLKSTTKYHRYYAKNQLGQERFYFLLHLPVETQQLEVGGVYYAFFNWQKIPKAREPFAFDYAKYLENKGVFLQTYLSYVPPKIGHQKGIKYFIAKWRMAIVDSFDNYIRDKEQKYLIQSLVFGQRQYLSVEMSKKYQTAGVMHVLAVSGLHVFVVFGVVYHTISLFTKNRKILFLLSLFFLVLFALLSGLSGSVTRAVLMCLLFLWGQLWQRNTESLYLMVASAFLILWFSTEYLFDIGFQLSYFALFSILYIFPLVNKYFTHKNPILNYFLGLIGVSLIVQIGVAPLTVYYFHQFSGLFLLGNIVVVPVSMLVLILAIIQIPFNFLGGFIPSFIGEISYFLIYFNHEYLDILTEKEIGVFGEIYLEKWEFLFLVIAIFTCVSWLKFRKFVFYYGTLFLVLFFALFQGYLDLKDSRKVYVFNRKNDLEIVYTNQNQGICFYTEKKNVFPYWRGKKWLYTPIKNYLETEDKFLIIDSLSVIPNVKNIDYVILHNNPKIHLEEMLKISPKKVIISQNNSFWKVLTWKNFLENHGIDYIDLRREGYWELKK